MTQAEVTPVKSSFDPIPLLVQELGLPPKSIAATLALFDEKATVPFIARYRKEATGGLDEVQIRTIEERRAYLTELFERRTSVLAEIEKQGKLTDSLRNKINACATKAELEDLYAPYKPKRRTRATIAKERGLEPLAERMWAQPADGSPRTEAAAFVNAEKEVPDVEAALAGARDICAERIADDAGVRQWVRQAFAAESVFKVGKTKEHEGKVTKFDDYAEHTENVAGMPTHRFLAIRRGENEGVLTATVELDGDRMISQIKSQIGIKPGLPFSSELELAAADAYKRLLATRAAVELRVELKANADKEAVEVFADNLKNLLLAAPFGERPVLGIDPGQRTGCKCAVVDNTGKFLHYETIHLVRGERELLDARNTLLALMQRFQAQAVAIGNGTHGRETEAFVREVLREFEATKSVIIVSVNEAGASVYSASDIAREEFPELDVSIRGAISIARRLQDPLAELVKIDPKSIGVGQYQHDVHQPMLAKKLDDVIEDCVNGVGVELNTASAPLLSRVAGLGPKMAQKLVEYRNQNGAFASRKALLSVPGLGPKTFEQAAGFLRVRGGEHPLDASAVHPERYELVERIAKDLGLPVKSLVGNSDAISRIDPERYMQGDVGRFTFNDIISELKKPGRDPRATFEPPKFRDDVRTMNDLKEGMTLDGVVTNVTAFGAFVDIGVHQAGLVHISQLADRFIKSASEVVSVGDKIQVRVLGVDLERNRISLSAKKQQDGGGRPSTGDNKRPGDAKGPGGRPNGGGNGNRPGGGRSQPKQFSNNPFARILSK